MLNFEWEEGVEERDWAWGLKTESLNREGAKKRRRLRFGLVKLGTRGACSALSRHTRRSD
jgi:hypothetical protein